MLRLMARPVRAHASGVATRVTQRGCVRAVDEDDGPAMSFYHLVADATLDGVQVSHLARARAPRYGDGPRLCARAQEVLDEFADLHYPELETDCAVGAPPHTTPRTAARPVRAGLTLVCTTSAVWRALVRHGRGAPIRAQQAGAKQVSCRPLARCAHKPRHGARTSTPARAARPRQPAPSGGGCARLVRDHETHARRVAGSCGSPRPSAAPSATTSTRPLHRGSTTATATDYCRRWRRT